MSAGLSRLCLLRILLLRIYAVRCTIHARLVRVRERERELVIRHAVCNVRAAAKDARSYTCIIPPNTDKSSPTAPPAANRGPVFTLYSFLLSALYRCRIRCVFCSSSILLFVWNKKKKKKIDFSRTLWYARANRIPSVKNHQYLITIIITRVRICI